MTKTKNFLIKLPLALAGIFACIWMIFIYFPYMTGDFTNPSFWELNQTICAIMMHTPILLSLLLWLHPKYKLKFRYHPIWSNFCFIIVLLPLIALAVGYCLGHMPRDNPYELGFFMFAPDTMLYSIVFGLIFGLFTLRSYPAWMFFIPFPMFFVDLILQKLIVGLLGIPLAIKGPPNIESYFESELWFAIFALSIDVLYILMLMLAPILWIFARKNPQ